MTWRHMTKAFTGNYPPRAPAPNLKDCHGKHGILSRAIPHSSANRIHISGTCGKCHDNEDEHYSRSAHGIALQQGVEARFFVHRLPRRAQGRAHQQQRVSGLQETHEGKVCLGCHLDNPEVRKRMGPSAGFIAEYEPVSHGVALSSGN